VRISPSGLHFIVKFAFWDAQHLCDKPSVLPKENNLSLLPIPERRYIDPQVARCDFPRPSLFKPFSYKSLSNCPGLRQRVVTQEANDGGQAVYSRDRATFFPLDDRRLLRSQSFPASFTVSFKSSRRFLMCPANVVGSGSSSSDFRYLSRTGTSGKKAMNP
jgi:hypothetical protein